MGAWRRRSCKLRPSLNTDAAIVSRDVVEAESSPSDLTSAACPPAEESPGTGSLTAESLTPQALDQLLFDAFVTRSRAQLELVRGLRILDETRFYLQLGYPTIHAYTEGRFGVRRSEAYDWIRIARGLEELPKLESAFADGEVGWSALKRVTRVATPETEGEWISFVGRHSCRAVEAEVKDALRKGRTRPRDDRFGLPNVTVRVAVEFTSDEHERFSKAVDKLAKEMSERCGGETMELKDVLLQLANLTLGSAPATGEGADPNTRIPIESNPYAVVYHVWPETEDGERRAVMSTAAGDLEIDAAVVDRVAGDAHIEVLDSRDLQEAEESDGGEESAEGGAGDPKESEIDRPNTARLRRKVLLRDGVICSNPCCDRPAVHAHHIQFRAHGGRTAAWNEAAVCAMCHALIHEGLLQVTGDPTTGLTWTPRSRQPRVDVRHEARLRAATVYSLAPASSASSSAESRGQLESARADSGGDTEDRDLASGLVSLGFTPPEARRRIEFARERVGATASEEEVLRVALERPTGGDEAASAVRSERAPADETSDRTSESVGEA